MWIVYLFLIYILALFYSLKNKNEKYILIYLIPMFFTLAFQVGIGTDYELYVAWLNYPETFSIKKGALFKSLLEVLNYFNNDRILFIVVAFFQIILLNLILKRLLKMKIIENIYSYFVILIIGTPIYYQMFNSLRSSISSLLFVLAVLNYKKIKILILCIIGFFVHSSMLIITPVLILKKYLNIYISKIIWGFYLVGCFIFMRTQSIYLVSNFIYNLNIDFKYKGYLVSEHMFRYKESLGIATLVQFFLCLFFIIFIYKKQKYIVLINLGIITFGLRMIFYYTPVLNRMLEYMNIFQGLVIYQLIIRTFNKKYFYLGGVLFIFYILCYIRQSSLML